MKKSRRQVLGQHFLCNRRVLDKIVRTIDPQKDELVIEIGPGRGALTFPLAEKAGRVVALEKDSRLVPGLQEKAPANLSLIEADALRVSFQEVLMRYPDFSPPVKLAGNLPYSISSPLLFKVLQEKELFVRCVFLLQKEVAQRVCAEPGSKQYAPLSILVQIHFDAKILITVSPVSFSPPPRVDSALIRLEKREHPLFILTDEKAFGVFLHIAFGHRRKTIWNNLVAAGFDRPALEIAFRKAGLDHRARAESLPIGQLVGLFLNNAIKKDCASLLNAKSLF
jgi:16S rRNA (adenine1518-N6/adenine1519-N6)-dimethyltransferase